jgi:hypothetical protein
MIEKTNDKQRLKKLLDAFSNPWVGIIGSVASIVGVLLAVYFYFQSVRSPQLVYYVNPARAVVVKQGTASRLSILFDGRQISQDVTASQIAIWNRGREPIRQAAVLKPIIIQMDPRTPILEATIRKKSREVVNLQMEQIRLSEGEVSLKWNILEQGDGAVVQLVYAGGPGIKIRCDGVIEGQSRVKELVFKDPSWPAAENWMKRNQVYFGVGFAIFLMAGLISIWISHREMGFSKSKLTIATLALLLLIGVILYLAFQSIIPEPPFGFE